MGRADHPVLSGDGLAIRLGRQGSTRRICQRAKAILQDNAAGRGLGRYVIGGLLGQTHGGAAQQQDDCKCRMSHPCLRS